MRKRIKMHPDTPATLPPELIQEYLLLSDQSKKLFNKAFRGLWRHLFGYEDMKHKQGLAVTYWILDAYRLTLSPPLSSSHLSVLSFLYYASANGSIVLHSDALYTSGCVNHLTNESKGVYLTYLVNNGYIKRSHRDASRPYLASSVSKNPVFLTMTDKTTKLFQDINKHIDTVMMRTSLTELSAIRKQKTPAKLSEG